MKASALVVSAVLVCAFAPSLAAQHPWVILPSKSEIKLWADSNSWVRSPGGLISVRLRVSEDPNAKPSDEGTILYMDFDCTKHLFRVRRTEFVKGEKVMDILPDSMTSGKWEAPNRDWLEDHQLQAACSKKP